MATNAAWDETLLCYPHIRSLALNPNPGLLCWKKDSHKKPVLAGKQSHTAYTLIKYSLIGQRKLEEKKRKALTKAFRFLPETSLWADTG